jgi:hypothetical protein
MTAPREVAITSHRLTRTASQTYLDLGGGGVLEAQREAAAALLARLLEQHLAVALLAAAPTHVHPLPRGRVAGEEHPAGSSSRVPPACLLDTTTTPEEEGKISKTSQ